jgi:hypothetical protein
MNLGRLRCKIVYRLTIDEGAEGLPVEGPCTLAVTRARVLFVVVLPQLNGTGRELRLAIVATEPADSATSSTLLSCDHN